jgi:AraC-like DNA-binding protein
MKDDTVQSLDEWEALVAASFYPLAVRNGRPNFSARIRQVALPYGTKVAEAWADDNHLRRDSKLVRTSGSDDLLLLIKLTGLARAESGHVAGSVAAGAAMLFDPSQPYDLITEGHCHELVFTCPRSLLPEVEEPRRTAIKFQMPAASLSVRALSGLLGQLATAEPGSVDTNELANVCVTVIELIGMMIRSVGLQTEQLQCSAASELRVLQAFALRELVNPRLSVEMMAASHGVSVRHVSAVFQKAGLSPASFIRDERLARSRADLASPRHAHRTVGEIARSWGFYDMTTFSRAFRRTYGVLPSEIRKAATPR